ncbi:MAG: hypothetical protein WKF75_15410 [Singulisphaera sp.]
MMFAGHLFVILAVIGARLAPVTLAADTAAGITFFDRRSAGPRRALL